MEAVVGSKIFSAISKARDVVLKTAVSKRGLKVAGGIAGGSGIMTWLASDNILSSMNIFTRDLREDVKWGNITPEDAEAKLEEAQEFTEKARRFININTMLNPLLWPFRGIVMANADAADLAIENNRETIAKGKTAGKK